MADISDDIDDWSATAASNSPSGATTIGTGLDDNLRALQAAIKKWRLAFEGAVGLSGLVQSQAADTDHDTTISAGVAMDSTGAYPIKLSAAITKRIDAAWAVGTNQGGLDGSESVAGTPDVSTWYYIWLIARSDTGVVDALYSESASAPTMPTNYDYKRLIGAVLTDSSANIIGYDAYEVGGGGLVVNWNASRLDVDSSALTTARLASTLSVPTSFGVDVDYRAFATDVGGANILVQSPDETDAAPSATATPGGTIAIAAGVGSFWTGRARTSATGTLAARASAAVDTFRVWTIGFHWGRR